MELKKLKDYLYGKDIIVAMSSNSLANVIVSTHTYVALLFLYSGGEVGAGALHIFRDGCAASMLKVGVIQ